MPPIRIDLLQAQRGDSVRRIGAALNRAPFERLTRELGIRGEDRLVSRMESKKEAWSF